MKLPDAPIIEKVRQWLTYADEDLRVARHAFSMPETPPCRVIAFHAQQCAEKYLKAYLVFHGVDFPFTHSLRRLLDLSASPAAWAERLRDAEELALMRSRQDIRERTSRLVNPKRAGLLRSPNACDRRSGAPSRMKGSIPAATSSDWVLPLMANAQPAGGVAQTRRVGSAL